MNDAPAAVVAGAFFFLFRPCGSGRRGKQQEAKCKYILTIINTYVKTF